jgi:hypothetical protein
MSCINETYRSTLPAEIQLAGQVLSPGFNPDSFPQLVEYCDPEKLMALLKKHRLYPAFHSLQLPFDQLPQHWQKLPGWLKQSTLANQVQMLHKTMVLVKVAAAFDTDTIPMLALKGPALAKVLYDNIAMKSSIDLDILIDEQHWEKAVAILRKAGFIRAKYRHELNQPQIRYLKKHFHHQAFFHPQDKVMLEMHWQLNTNKYLLPYSFDELYNNALTVNFGNHNIKTIDPQRAVIYLMIHGAYHAWARLDWLYEFSRLTHNGQLQLGEIVGESKRHGLENLLSMSFRLSNIVFHTRLPEAKRGNDEHPMLRFCIHAIIKGEVADYTRPVKRISQKFYLMRFRDNIRYKLHVWKALSTNSLDWETVKLPPRLFLLYFFLRPLLVLLNKWKGKPHPTRLHPPEAM